MGKTAKIFMNGRSQAVRLPAEFRFKGAEVHIRRDPHTGDVILSERPKDWSALFAAIAQIDDIPEDFLSKDDRIGNTPLRDPFEDWDP